MREIKLLVATPTCRKPEPKMVQCGKDMTLHLFRNGISGREFNPLSPDNYAEYIGENGSVIADSRQAILDHAISNNFTHVVMIDDDQTFPPNMMDLFFRENHPVIGANVCFKSFSKIDFNSVGMNGMRVSSIGKTGCEQVKRVGGGIMMIELECLANLPKPWFCMPYNPESGRVIPEDYFFCLQLEKAAIPIYIDHDVSNLVTHIAAFGIGPSSVTIT